MNFTIKQETLLVNLTNVSRALSNKAQMPGLTGILFNVYKDRIVLTACNNEIAIQCEIKDNITVIEEGNVLLQGKFLLDIVKKITTQDVDFMTFEENTVKVLAGKSVFTINTLQLDSFTEVKFGYSNVKFTIDVLNLKQIIRKTSFAISNNESRVVLTGVSLNTKKNAIEVVATDSYRLAKKRLEFDYDFPEINIVIPGKNFDELSKIMEDNKEIVEVYCSSQQILFKYKNLLFQSRLIEGVFPKIDALIPVNYLNNMTFNKEELISLIERVSVFVSNEASNIIKMILISKDVVEFTSVSNEIGAAREEISPISATNSNLLQIAFSSKYFIDALRTFDSDEITINFTGEVKPFTITSDKDVNLVQLILPVRA